MKNKWKEIYYIISIYSPNNQYTKTQSHIDYWILNFVVMIYIAITQGKFTFPQTKFIITIINDWLWGSNFFSNFYNTKLADSMNGIVPPRNKIFWKFLPTFITPYSHQILSRNNLQFCLIWDFELRVARYIYLESRKFGFLCILEFRAATRPLF